MVEAFRVQSRLTLQSNVPQVLAQVARALGTLDGRLKATERSIDKLMEKMGGLRGFQFDINAAAGAMGGFERAATGAARAASRQKQAVDEGSRALVRYTNAAQQAQSAVRALVSSPRLLSGPTGSGESYGALVPTPLRLMGPSGGGGLGALAPLIAARTTAGISGGGSLPPGAVPMLAAPAAGGGGGMQATFAAGLAGMAAGGGGRRGFRWFWGGGGGGGQGGTGGGAAGGGAGGSGVNNLAGMYVNAHLGHQMLGWVGEAIKAGGELEHQVEVLRQSGVSAKLVGEAVSRAWETTKLVRGTTAIENLKAIGELQTVFGDTHEAVTLLPRFQKLAAVLGSVTGKDPGNSAYLAARALELRGAFINPQTGQMDVERGLGQLNLMQRGVIATHGRVGPNDYLNFQQMAGVGGRRLGDTAMYEQMPTIIQAMGGHRAGTAYAAFYRQMVGGVMTQRVAAELIKYGLIDESHVQVKRGGQIVVQPGGVKGADQLAANPLQWINTVLRGQLVSKGASSLDEQMDVVSRLFGTETARRFVAEALQGWTQIEKDQALIRRVRPDAAENLLDKDWNITVSNLSAAFKNLETALGGPTLRVVVPVMNALAGGLNKLAEWATAHPDLATVLVAVAGALGTLAAGTAVLGALALGIGALAGAISLPILAGGALAAIAAGLTGLALSMDGKDWKALFDRVIGGLQSVWDSITAKLSNPPSADQTYGPPAPRRTGRMGPGGFYGDSILPQSFEPVPAGPAATAQPVVLMLDGRKVGEGVMPYFGRAALGPAQSATQMDQGRAVPVSMRWA
ncbi:hypothetical protein [Roseomonas mucosa]|uniref:hypothetical protein n=1 Tax=Roseomonas mucosa TaxID=207340 RepID=UPI00224735AD|nr:hypothetical protein [Roseomonas mucosa]UZO91771.1 PGRS-subfamily of Gly-rich protein [Roseomonas mucosa]